jgi:hypothetical protein
MLILALLRWLGLDNKYLTRVRPGVLQFAVFSLGAILLFIAFIVVGSYLGWVH